MIHDDIYDGYIVRGTLLARDFWTLIVGDKIGSGVARDVYEFIPDKTKVIKFDHTAGGTQNVAEWLTWEYVKDRPDLRKWFAPCYRLSDCGSCLLQARVTPLKESRAPRRMPKFFCDFKYDNYGIYKGRVVCSDYGLMTQIFQHGLETAAKRKADWWTTKAKE